MLLRRSPHGPAFEPPPFLAAGDADAPGRPGFADRQIWARIDDALIALAASGRRSIAILDAGCGSGAWLRRVVARADAVGFTRIAARGLDGSAVALAQDALAGRGLPEADRSVDLCLCLGEVLNQAPPEALAGIAAELGRVTAGRLFVTLRAAASPTGHLLRARDLRALFAPHVSGIALTGLDLFHSRFAADRRADPDEGGTRARFADRLDGLEQAYAADPAFIDHAARIMLTAGAG